MCVTMQFCLIKKTLTSTEAEDVAKKNHPTVSHNRWCSAASWVYIQIHILQGRQCLYEKRSMPRASQAALDFNPSSPIRLLPRSRILSDPSAPLRIASEKASRPLSPISLPARFSDCRAKGGHSGSGWDLGCRSKLQEQTCAYR